LLTAETCLLQRSLLDRQAGLLANSFINGHGATVAYGSPKPLIWVRILVPVQINLHNLIPR
jgi:hypothetical protein